MIDISEFPKYAELFRVSQLYNVWILMSKNLSRN